MENNKTSRAGQTRSKTERPKVWTPPSSLDAPKAPDGYRHRWIRVYPVVPEGKYKGMIGVGGLVLARIPEEIAKQRDAYYQNMTREANEALQHDLDKEQHKSMPISQDRQSRVTFGGTKKE